MYAQLCKTFCKPKDIAHQAPLSVEFSRQESWSGLLLPPPGDFPYARIKPVSLVSPALAGGFFTTEASWKPHIPVCMCTKGRRPQAYTCIHSWFSSLMPTTPGPSAVNQCATGFFLFSFHLHLGKHHTPSLCSLDIHPLILIAFFSCPSSFSQL